MKRIGRFIGIGLLVAGCASGGVNATVTPSGTPAAGATPSRTTGPVATPRPVETPTVTPEPTGATFAPGDTITVTRNGAKWAEVTITKVAAKASYAGAYYTDKPASGNVYLQFYVTYSALVDGVTYNPYDWQMFVDDVAVTSYTFVQNGPKPALGSGTLPTGRKAQGWIVYEIPKTGRVVFSYGGIGFTNDAPIFEVVLRSK